MRILDSDGARNHRQRLQRPLKLLQEALYFSFRVFQVDAPGDVDLRLKKLSASPSEPSLEDQPTVGDNQLTAVMHCYGLTLFNATHSATPFLNNDCIQ
jgi:hypothetical protein